MIDLFRAELILGNCLKCAVVVVADGFAGHNLLTS